MFDNERFEKEVMDHFHLDSYAGRNTQKILEYFLGDNFRLEMPEINYMNLYNIMSDEGSIRLIGENGKIAVVHRFTEGINLDIYEIEQNGPRLCKSISITSCRTYPFQMIEYEDDESMFCYVMGYCVSHLNKNRDICSRVNIEIEYYNPDTVKIFKDNMEKFDRTVFTYRLCICCDKKVSKEFISKNPADEKEILDELYALKVSLKDSVISKRMVKKGEQM